MSDARCPRCGGPAVADQIAVPSSSTDPGPWPTVPGQLRCAARCDTRPSAVTFQQAAQIARDLAARDCAIDVPVSSLTDETAKVCITCDAVLEGTTASYPPAPTEHTESCPWRRAREWVDARDDVCGWCGHPVAVGTRHEFAYGANGDTVVGSCWIVDTATGDRIGQCGTDPGNRP